MTDRLTSIECAHCKAPVPQSMLALAEETEEHTEPKYFCCIGCQTVYYALGDLGLEDFYQWRDLDGREVRPAEEVKDVVEVSRELLLEHAIRHEDGTLETELGLDGISCSGCVWLVEQMPRFVDGVVEAQLNLGKARLKLRWQEEVLTDPTTIMKWLAQFGYEATPLRTQEQSQYDKQERAMLRRVGVSWALAGNVMLLSWAHYAGLDLQNEPTLAFASQVLMWLMVLASVVYGGGIILRRAYYSLRAFFQALISERQLLSLSMDVPLALGITMGWLYSTYAVFAGTGELWFDSIAMLIAAIITARWLQQRANSRAKHMARQLLEIIPRNARKVGADGEVEDVSVDDLLPGDLVEVRMGDVCPADGIIDQGEGALHRGILTGESVPERMGPGSRVEAGTKNVAGHFTLRVQAVGNQSRVGELLEWINEQDVSRSEVMQRIDKLGGWFVLIVLSAVCVAGSIWWQTDPAKALSIMIAMLVVSCPCAIGMATPLALALTMARGTRRGVFIKHDDVLEKIEHVNHVIFDKTGTLTTGDMQVVSTIGEPEDLKIAQHLERFSSHPLAQAITLYGQGARRHKGEYLKFEDIHEAPALGMQASYQGEVIRLGKPTWILSELDASDAPQGDLHHELLNACENVAQQGASPVLMSRGGRLVAMFGVGDTVREDAYGLIEDLKAQNIHVQVLSGDHPALVQAVGEKLGLSKDDIMGGQSPEDKLTHILRVKERGATVMMVGDGVNDAAAMQAADVGIAVKGGAQVSLVAADIFLTYKGLSPVLEVIQASKRVQSLVYHNVMWLVVYNIVGIVLAGMGLVTPLVAAILMPLSSLGLVAMTVWTKTFELSFGQQESPDEHIIRSHTTGAATGSRSSSSLPLGSEPGGV